MLDSGCGSALSSANVFVDSNNPYGIVARQNNYLGYSETFCFRCGVTPTGSGLSAITIDKVIIVTADFDCSQSLINKGFQNPPIIKYDATGNNEIIIKSFPKQKQVPIIHPDNYQIKPKYDPFDGKVEISFDENELELVDEDSNIKVPFKRLKNKESPDWCFNSKCIENKDGTFQAKF